MIRKLFDVSDEVLLQKLRKNNQLALQELYARYWDQLYINAYKILKSKSASEDVVQEIFIDLWEKRKFNSIGNLPAYLYQATKYKTLMALRRNNIQQKHLDILENIKQEQFADSIIELKELREEVVNYLDNLPERCREVFYKSRFEHNSNQEIAEQLGISKRTVETHISNALKYLRGVKELLVMIIIFLCS
ncbi:RNA polymerase sigma factor [Membranihabitans maritimus]|uniref:RNA polymerase sigma factor n=1 Tax=Membranihabitans maritimus TaxID=2904244 RepID=UPI001EFF99D1|nr:RNA polymerase sigma-70 factor [Membranihabitans maritimus]